MRRLVPTALCLLAALAATARGDLTLEAGTMTQAKVRIVNHNDEPIKNLRIRMTTNREWLKVAMPADLEVVEKDEDGNPTVWAIDKIAQAAGSARELAVEVTITGPSQKPVKPKDDKDAAPAAGGGDPPAPAGDPGEEGKDGKKENVESHVGHIGEILFVVWRDDDNPGQERKAGRPVSDKLGVPPWRSWKVDYMVVATYPELAKKPTDMEWHLVDAKRGTTNRRINMTIHNKSEFKPLLNLMVIPTTPPGLITVSKATAEEKIVVNNVQGMKVIEEGKKGTFEIDFSVHKGAKPGQTGQVRFWVRTSTLGADPNPWDPTLMVNITARREGLKGNFEAFVYYNLKELKKSKDKDAGPKGVDESTWMPVPKGTKLTIMQIFQLRGGGQQKIIEQMVGYGNVIDDTGYAICNVRPEQQHQLRFRIVADTMASVIELEYDEADPTTIVGFSRKNSRAAVTPFGRRVFRCISHPFLVEKQEETSLFAALGAKKAKGAAEGAAEDGEAPAPPAAGEKRPYYRAKPGQSGKFVIGNKVLIPYYGYEHDVDPKRKKGILIKWEGELSTGGYISPLTAPGVMDAGSVGGGFGIAQSQLARFSQGKSYGEAYAEESIVASNLPGLIYHNHNELLHVLAGLVRAQESIAGLDYFNALTHRKRPKDEDADAGADAGDAAGAGAHAEADAHPDGGKEPEVGERTPPKLPGVVAYSRKGARIEGGETGYALFKDPRRKSDKGVWRLMVQANPEDPDERDLGLVLRGYGAALRRKFWVRNEQESDDDKQKPNYTYYERTSIDEAWKQGFDIFFAATVLNSPEVRNDVATETAAREKRSVNLETIVREAAKAEGKRVYREKYHRLRGADNAVAVAAGLWQAAQAMSSERLINEILYEEGGSFFWFLNLVRREEPDLLKDFMSLGLCPVVERWPPPASLKGSVSPEAVRVLWHPNDMVAKGKLKATIIFATSSDGKATRIAMKGGKDPKAAREYPFGELRDGKEGDAQLASKLRNGQKLFWTVETSLATGAGGQRKHTAFKWPLQDFTAEIASTAISGHDRSLYANSRSNRTVGPEDARDASINNRTIHSVLGGRKVLGGAVYTVRINKPAPKAPVPDQFANPVRLALRWRKDEDPGDATPAIYFRNPDSQRWQMVGNKRSGKREVEAMITHAGNYALMVDHLPPQFESLVDLPDPFPASVEGVTWKLRGQLSEPAALTLTIEDKAGKVLRTLAKDKQVPVGPLEVTWDGKDDAGKTVAGGTYTYRLLARDESKREAKPLTGKVTVLVGITGSAEGTVTLAAKSKNAPRVNVVDTTLSAQCEDDGAYWFLGLTQATHLFRFSAQGHFEEDRKVELKTKGGELKLKPVTLTNVAVEALKPSGEVFTPDGDGKDDYLSLNFTMVRECPLDVGVYDSDGELVSALQVGKAMTKGEAVLLWQGLDDNEIAQPSGWYTIRLIAHSRREGIPQGDIKVLLDRGLVRNAHAFPNTFSPNDDGFDDVLEIGYTLDDDAIITIRIIKPDGSPVKEIVTDKQQRKGWTIATWDGTGADGKVVPDGSYAFEVRPKYLSGHASIVARGELMADSLPPKIAEAKPLNGSTITTGTPTVSAKIVSDLADVSPSQLKIKIDENTVLADAYDENTGVFSFTPKTSLGEGVHIAIAYAQDWAGNYAPPQAVSFNVDLSKTKDEKFIDRTKPQVLDLQPSKSTIVYTATPLITAQVRDAESGIDPNNIVIYFNGERVSNAVRSFIPGKSGKPWDWYSYEKAIVLYDPLAGDVRYVPIEPLKEGKNHVSLEVFDRQGNKSKLVEAIFEVVIDNQPPSVLELAPAHQATLAKPDVVVKARLKDTGKSGLALDTLTFSLDGQPVPVDTKSLDFNTETGLLTLPLASPLSRDAQHAVLLTVRDRAGNISKPASSVFSIVADGEAPRVDIISRRPDGPMPADGPVLFAAALYDLGRSGIDPATVALSLDGKAIPADNRDTTAVEGYLLTRGLLTHKLAGLKPGRHTVALGVEDKAGNKANHVMWQFEIK